MEVIHDISWMAMLVFWSIATILKEGTFATIMYILSSLMVMLYILLAPIC